MNIDFSELENEIDKLFLLAQNGKLDWKTVNKMGDNKMKLFNDVCRVIDQIEQFVQVCKDIQNENSNIQFKEKIK